MEDIAAGQKNIEREMKHMEDRFNKHMDEGFDREKNALLFIGYIVIVHLYLFGVQAILGWCK